MSEFAEVLNSSSVVAPAWHRASSRQPESKKQTDQLSTASTVPISLSNVARTFA